MFDHLGDEILTHGSLSSNGLDASTASHVHDLSRDRPEEEEDEDGDVPHPEYVNNWGSDLRVGQVAAVDVDNDDNPVIFHRGCHVWGPKYVSVLCSNTENCTYTYVP